jgi:hypothetical protein
VGEHLLDAARRQDLEAIASAGGDRQTEPAIVVDLGRGHDLGPRDRADRDRGRGHAAGQDLGLLATIGTPEAGDGTQGRHPGSSRSNRHAASSRISPHVPAAGEPFAGFSKFFARAQYARGVRDSRPSAARTARRLVIPVVLVVTTLTAAVVTSSAVGCGGDAGPGPDASLGDGGVDTPIV